MIQDFLNAPTEVRLKMALRDELADELIAYLGPPAYDEYRALASKTVKPGGQVLSAKTPKNLIFVPGVMGSLLTNKNKPGLWWIDVRSRDKIDQLKLAPDGVSEADPNNEIIPATIDITYDAFISAVLERDDFGHVSFAYDWRKPLLSSTELLKDLILSTHAGNGQRPVHLVAHSMGGLMVRATLMRHGEQLWPVIGRVVFIGTPHYGSPAIAGYLKHHLWGFNLMALMGLYLSRETFRSLWGVLSLLPAPKRVYPGTRQEDQDVWPTDGDGYSHPCVNFDLYDATSWRLNLTTPDSPLGLGNEQQANLQRILSAAKEFHQQMHDAHMSLSQTRRNQMAVIVGVGYETLFRLAYRHGVAATWKEMDKVKSPELGNPHREGDGRVPQASALLKYIKETRFVRGVHGELPSIPAVYQDVFRWLNGQSMQLPTTAQAALSASLGAAAPSAVAPNLAKITPRNPLTGDPGYLNFDDLSPEELQDLNKNVENFPEFNRLHLL